MLRVLKVYRHRSSGKLIALGIGNGYAFPLNSDLTFSSKEPHRIRRSTQLELTPYRIEVELQTKGGQSTYQKIRTWDENHLPQKSADPNSLLEHRIDVSPSQEFNDAERRYVGQSSGHPISFLLFLSSLILLGAGSRLGWWPSLLAFTAGIFVIWKTKTPGDIQKIFEVEKAKERIRQEAERKLTEAMRDVRFWAALDGIGFEQAMAKLYREQGFDVEFTPRTNDQGVDLILRKNGAISIVQCKAYTNNVGVSAVRELIGVRSSWPNTTEAILATVFDFSSAAKTLATEQHIKLFSVTKDHLKTDYRPET